jgi:serine/threonine protein kinase
MIQRRASQRSNIVQRARGNGVALRVRQRIGKYRIVQHLGEGGFARVYKAMDTIEGIHVALKIPHESQVTQEVMDEFRKEIRIQARLDHPNILRIKDASVIEERLVIAIPLAERTLDERLRRRLSLEKAIDYSEQVFEAVAYAHRMKVIHCDLKPENILIFSDNRIRLADFGISKIAQKIVKGAGTGTVGYMAPEQAMGRPSLRSDVFSLGLMTYRMLSGHWPEWPYEWPCHGYHRLRGRIHREMIEFLKRSIEANPRRRFADAVRMLSAFQMVKEKTLRHARKATARRSQKDTHRR